MASPPISNSLSAFTGLILVVRSIKRVVLRKKPFKEPPFSGPAVATASSDNDNAFKSTDGDAATRWSSDANDNEWFQINLGSIKTINKVVIDWEAAYDRDYAVQTSIDGTNYMTVYTTSAGDGGTVRSKSNH